MNFLKERINTMFSDLIFDERRHLYFVDNENYPSVSSHISGLTPKFDEKKYSKAVALRENTTQEAIIDRWRTYNKERIEVGHITHNFLEVYNGVQTARTNEERAGVKFLTDTLKDHMIIDREIRMYSREYKFAGTADIPLMSRVTGKVIVADYKTNLDLFKSYDFLLSPFDYFEASPFNKYQIQLSLYQLMLEEIGIPVEERWIVHLKPDATYRVFKTINLVEDLKNDYFTTKQVA